MQEQSSAVKGCDPTNSKALVLCSSGLDSTYNLLRSKKEFQKVTAVFFDYSQKSSPQEYIHVKKLCQALNVDFIKIDLPWYRVLGSSLISRTQEITRFSSADEADKAGTPPEWVPNRNGVFINAAAAVAESGGYGTIIIGINKEEATRYPDNTAQFLKKGEEFFRSSTLTHPKLISYTVDMMKDQIFTELMELAGQLGIKNIKEYIWSCYDSYEKMCGKCESCLRLKRVIKEHRQENEWKDRFSR